MPFRKIDCHMHFWSLALEPHYHLWMTPDLGVLYRDYSPQDALPLMQANDVEGVVLVSAASSMEEIGYLMGLADGHDIVKGVVAWFDLLSGSAPADIESWARFSKLRGVRPYLQDIEDDSWILQPALEPAIQAITDCGLTFDALIKAHQIRNTVTFIERHPDLPVIIDHLAKPDVSSAGLKTWSTDMQAFRDMSHVYCKVSGLVTEAGIDWTSDSIAPYLDVVFDVFGPERLVFGSDWPVVNLVSDYGTWVDTLQGYMKGLSAQEQQAIWADNGERFYGLRQQSTS